MDEKIVKDYISRRQAVYVCLELIHERRKWLSDAGQKEISGIDAAMCAIQDLPSAQPEIIRCRDCKHYYFADNRIPQEQRYVCDIGGEVWQPDDYCSYAERR